jgi:hypothetical protein
MTRFYYDLNGNPIQPHTSYRTFKDKVRTANHVAPLDSGTPVTRDEYDALNKRLDAVEALLSKLSTANAVNDVNDVNSDVNKPKADRAAYMREYMAKKRAEKKAAQ